MTTASWGTSGTGVLYARRTWSARGTPAPACGRRLPPATPHPTRRPSGKIPPAVEGLRTIPRGRATAPASGPSPRRSRGAGSGDQRYLRRHAPCIAVRVATCFDDCEARVAQWYDRRRRMPVIRAAIGVASSSRESGRVPSRVQQDFAGRRDRSILAARRYPRVQSTLTFPRPLMRLPHPDRPLPIAMQP